jgi:hypothetical protein
MKKSEIYKNLLETYRDCMTPVQEAMLASMKVEIVNEELLPCIAEVVRPFGEMLGKLRLQVEFDEENGVLVKPLDTNNGNNGQQVSVSDQVEEPAENEDQEDDESMNSFTVRNASVGFSVKFADGTVIRETDAKTTMVEALRYIGFEKAATYRGDMFMGYPLVGKQKRPLLKSSDKWQEKHGEWYIYTNLANDRKIRVLNDLARSLHVEMEIVPDGDIPKPKVRRRGSIPEVDDTRFYVEGRVVNQFVFQVVRKIYKLDENFDVIRPYFRPKELITVEKEGEFKLQGLFINCSEEELRERNTRSTSTRWFDYPFKTDKGTLYLCNQWVDKESGQLRFSEFQKLVNSCYGNLLNVSKTNDGRYVMTEA